MTKYILVGGLEHEFHFSIQWEFHHPNWRTHIFQRGWNHQPVYLGILGIHIILYSVCYIVGIIHIPTYLISHLDCARPTELLLCSEKPHEEIKIKATWKLKRIQQLSPESNMIKYLYKHANALSGFYLDLGWVDSTLKFCMKPPPHHNNTKNNKHYSKLPKPGDFTGPPAPTQKKGELDTRFCPAMWRWGNSEACWFCWPWTHLPKVQAVLLKLCVYSCFVLWVETSMISSPKG